MTYEMLRPIGYKVMKFARCMPDDVIFLLVNQVLSSLDEKLGYRKDYAHPTSSISICKQCASIIVISVEISQHEVN